MSSLFLNVSVNKIIYWTFIIWLKMFLFSLRHRRDRLFRQIVAPGNPWVFHPRSGGPPFRALVKLLEGLLSLMVWGKCHRAQSMFSESCPVSRGGKMKLKQG